MNLFQSLSGMVQVEITSADTASAMDELARQGFLFFHTHKTGDLTVLLEISRKDVKNVRRICEKRGDRLRIRKRQGMYWTGKSMLKRPVLLLGAVLLLLGTVYLPGKVFFVQVEGNGDIPARQIIAAAEECGICFGASRREVRSERVKNALLEAMPQLQWAGVNTYGCVAVISVRERELAEKPRQESGNGNIVAIRDGVILSCTATKGNLLCMPGQAVTAGEVLISGYTDCGISIRAEQAEGEVYAQTRRSIRAVLWANSLRRTEKTDENRKISLLLGKKRINLWKDSGISDTTCDRIYEEYYVTLPGGFQLPLGLAVEHYTSWNTAGAQQEQEEAEQLLSSFGEIYLKNQMVAGSVRSSEIAVLPEGNVYRLEGEYVCVEMIASMQRQQIGEYNGENN